MRFTKIPPGEVGRHVQLLAEKHAITYTPTHHDKLATVLTNFSGDDVVLDNIENLLLALERAGVLSNEEFYFLLVDYLKDKGLITTSD